MQENPRRLRSRAWFALVLFTLTTAWAAFADNKQGGRRRGSMTNLNGDPPAILPFFRLTTFDPQIFTATCTDPVDAANGAEGLVCRELLGGFDHVAAGTALRNTGSGTIALRGAPPGAEAIAAFLVWSLIADLPTATGPEGQTMDVTFDGHRVTGERVASIEELCWDSLGHSVHYSADVTRFIPRAINRVYELSGVPSSITDGRNPFEEDQDPPLPWAQGASLIVVYTHPEAEGRVYLHEGVTILADAMDLDLELSPSPPADGATVLRHTRIGGDGQTQDGGPLLPFATFLGDAQPDPGEVQIRGPGSPINLSSDWQGQDGAPTPGLWDTQSDKLSGPQLLGGATSYALRWVAVDDPGGLDLNFVHLPKKSETEPPPQPPSKNWDCVYIGAIAMTTTY